ncbi:thermonuclease family protein [Salipiger mangrovisoli]|uniref:Thermonuclease family protein n=1 Tax=Salipiger mangrovisoli TaxID=2865933 RepID=A0ABR9X4S2_9RHOB|nr:thermonuclease family protein [Salipiger mangrovisoli]MBE9638441.1 thermonuclease family protein [Salipiger mangrovisoli]
MIRICSRFVSVIFTIVSLTSLVAALGAGPAQAAQAAFSGKVRVIDGDTFDVGDVRVRLFGVDAPEKDQTCGGGSQPNWACGAWVTSEVRARYEGRRARCERLDTDRYGRAVARCAVDGQDVGRTLVSDGLAFAYREYSLDYDLDEKRAAVRGVGVHGTQVQRPADYRAESRATANAAALAEAPKGCVIKGNISAKGARIYHMPGQQHYAPTRIDESSGERWFCSEAEARNAGWRKARQ